MSKLHELLAVESSLRTQAEATRNDLINTFEKKRTHFQEVIQTFTPFAEGSEPKVEAKMGLQSTIAKELEWISVKLSKAINSGYQIDIANLVAKADVVLDDGRIMLRDVPATSLLQLEKRLAEVQTLVTNIPTLDPAKGFTPDTDRGSGIFKARDVEKTRTEKKVEVLELAKATDKHPAQVKEITVDRGIGIILQQEWSSLITVAAKGDMLDRVEELLRAVKKARSRANEVEIDVKTNQIADDLLTYVFEGT